MSDGVEGAPVQLSVPVANAGPATVEENRLRRGVISLPDTIAQSVTVMAPALSAAFISYLAAIKAGGATPLAFLLAMGSCLVVGCVVSEFALRLPSAGSLYTYTVNGLGSFSGFVVGCSYLFGGVLAGVAVLAGFSVFTSQLMGNLGAPGFLQEWSLWYAVGLLLYFFLSYFGIVFSTRTQLVFTAATMATLLLLAAIIIGKGGAHGNTLDAFRPGAAGVSWPLILGGLAFGIFSFMGFETAASLAEESRNPRRNIPAAVIGAVVVVGIFYVIVTYATSIGYGVREATTAWPESAGGLAALTRRYAPYLGDWVLLAGGLAGLFSGLATHNVFTRVLYAMGREGVLPRAVGRTHRVHQTPHVAIFLSLALLGAVAPVMIGVTSQATRDAIGAAPGPLSSGFYLFAEGFTIAAPLGILCLVMVSIAGLRFAVSLGAGWPRARSVAVSLGSLVVTTVGLIGSLYYSFVEMAPGAGIPGPYGWPGGSDDAGGQGLVEGVEGVDLDEPGHPFHHVEAERALEGSGCLQELVGRLGQAGEPPGHHLPHASRDSELPQRLGGDPAPVRPLIERPFLNEVAQQLMDEEGIALGLMDPGRPHLLLHFVAADRGQEPGHLGGVETLEVEVLVARFPGDDPEEIAQRVGRVELEVRIGAEEEDALLRGDADQVANHRHGAAIGPLEVVDHEEDRSSSGAGDEELGHGVE